MVLHETVGRFSEMVPLQLSLLLGTAYRLLSASVESMVLRGGIAPFEWMVPGWTVHREIDPFD